MSGMNGCFNGDFTVNGCDTVSFAFNVNNDMIIVVACVVLTGAAAFKLFIVRLKNNVALVVKKTVLACCYGFECTVILVEICDFAAFLKSAGNPLERSIGNSILCRLRGAARLVVNIGLIVA